MRIQVPAATYLGGDPPLFRLSLLPRPLGVESDQTVAHFRFVFFAARIVDVPPAPSLNQTASPGGAARHPLDSGISANPLANV